MLVYTISNFVLHFTGLNDGTAILIPHQSDDKDDPKLSAVVAGN